MSATIQAKQPVWLRPAVLDRVEQVLVVMLWLWLVWRVDTSDNHFAWLLLLSESAICFFTLIRRPTDKLSMRLGDWLLAMTATSASLLVVPGVNIIGDLAPLALGIFVGGNLFQLWAKLVLRRSFGVAPANRGIKVSGPYAIVRHPMYMGYGIIHISLLLLMFYPVNLVLYAIGWWAQILRILAEERVLSEDPAYRDYMKRVPWRLIPGIF